MLGTSFDHYITSVYALSTSIDATDRELFQSIIPTIGKRIDDNNFGKIPTNLGFDPNSSSSYTHRAPFRLHLHDFPYSHPFSYPSPVIHRPSTLSPTKPPVKLFKKNPNVQHNLRINMLSWGLAIFLYQRLRLLKIQFQSYVLLSSFFCSDVFIHIYFCYRYEIKPIATYLVLSFVSLFFHLFNRFEALSNVCRLLARCRSIRV
ncbi:hypothetical protein L1887_29089 [Cichorium endivia]|nr:hypothetical protein L1887_29089 [Cichorium endivia]